MEGRKATIRTALCILSYWDRMQISSNISGHRHNIFLDDQGVAFVSSHKLHCAHKFSATVDQFDL